MLRCQLPFQSPIHWVYCDHHWQCLLLWYSEKCILSVLRDISSCWVESMWCVFLACCFELEVDLWPWGWPSCAFDLLLPARDVAFPTTIVADGFFEVALQGHVVCTSTSVGGLAPPSPLSYGRPDSILLPWMVDAYFHCHLVELCPTDQAVS